MTGVHGGESRRGRDEPLVRAAQRVTALIAARGRGDEDAVALLSELGRAGDPAEAEATSLASFVVAELAVSLLGQARGQSRAECAADLGLAIERAALGGAWPQDDRA